MTEAWYIHGGFCGRQCGSGTASEGECWRHAGSCVQSLDLPYSIAVSRLTKYTDQRYTFAALSRTKPSTFDPHPHSPPKKSKKKKKRVQCGLHKLRPDTPVDEAHHDGDGAVGARRVQFLEAACCVASDHWHFFFQIYILVLWAYKRSFPIATSSPRMHYGYHQLVYEQKKNRVRLSAHSGQAAFDSTRSRFGIATGWRRGRRRQRCWRRPAHDMMIYSEGLKHPENVMYHWVRNRYTHNL